MNEKIRGRRRSVRRERGRRRRTLAVLVILVLCVVALYVWLRSSDVFAVERITATGAERVTKGQIARATTEAVGVSLLSLSTGAIEEALLALPYVQSVEVHRCFPNTLEIDLAEYEPVARLQAEGGEIWLVSDGGRVLQGTDAAQFPELPLLVADGSLLARAGEQVPTVVADVLPLAVLLQTDEIRAQLPGLTRIGVSATGCAVLVLEGGGEVRLGDPIGLEQKLRVAVDIVQQCLAEGRQIEYVDASVADRVAVKAK
jgi:cell division septal protein FtsQ